MVLSRSQFFDFCHQTCTPCGANMYNRSCQLVAATGRTEIQPTDQPINQPTGVGSSFELWLCKLFLIGALLFTLLCCLTNYHLPRDMGMRNEHWNSLGSVNIMCPFWFVGMKNVRISFAAEILHSNCALLSAKYGRQSRKISYQQRERNLPRCNRMFIYTRSYLGSFPSFTES